MNLSIIFFIIICGALLWVTIGRKEAFPFSWYPMYSGPNSLDKVRVFRIALEKTGGEITWWRSRFYRYPEYTGRKLKELRYMLRERVQNEVFVLLERNRLLLEVMRLIESEEGSVINYKAFHIVERTISDSLEITDRTVEVVSFTELRNGKPA